MLEYRYVTRYYTQLLTVIIVSKLYNHTNISNEVSRANSHPTERVIKAKALFKTLFVSFDDKNATEVYILRASFQKIQKLNIKRS